MVTCQAFYSLRTCLGPVAAQRITAWRVRQAFQAPTAPEWPLSVLGREDVSSGYAGSSSVRDPSCLNGKENRKKTGILSLVLMFLVPVKTYLSAFRLSHQISLCGCVELKPNG